MARLMLNILILTLVSSFIAADPCAFPDPVLGIINITSLGNKDGPPKYTYDGPAGPGYIFAFNPCFSFNDGDCKDVALCQILKSGTDRNALGTQNSATWEKRGDSGLTAVLTFSSPARRSTIDLECSEDGAEETFEYIKEEYPLYFFKWKNRCLCWNACKNGGGGDDGSSGSGGMTGGGIFLIVLVCVFGVYCAVFALFNGFGRKRRGLDIVPHREFWFGVPVYAKDGVTYIFRRVTGKGGNYQSV